MKKNAERQAELEKREKIHEKKIYQGRVIVLKVDSFRAEDGRIYEREVVVHPGAVAILPIAENGDIYLVKQWRRAAQKILIELPAGTLEENEKPIDCARRELQEEIGLKAHSIIPLGGFFSAPGFCSEYLHLFLAENLEPSILKAEDTDKIDVLKVSLENALEMIDLGLIEDAKTVAVILQYHRRKKV